MTLFYIRATVELEIEADTIDEVIARWQEKTVFDMLDAGAFVYGETLYNLRGEELCEL